MGMAENTRERGREQAGMTREGRRTMEKVLENTVRDTYRTHTPPDEDHKEQQEHATPSWESK